MSQIRVIAMLLILLMPLTGWAGDLNNDLLSAAKKGKTTTGQALRNQGANVNARHELWYVVNADPPSVTIVDPEELKIVGDIPLDPNPSYVLMGPQNRFLYVLYNGAFNLTGKAIEDVSEVAILDTASRTWVKRIPVGWRVYKMLFWKDDRSLVCFSIGRSGSKKLEEEPSLATAIDTRTNEVAATFTGKKYGIEYEIIMDPENWTGE